MRIFTLPDNINLIVGDKEFLVLDTLSKTNEPLDNKQLAEIADTTPSAINVMIHNLRGKLRKEKSIHVIHNVPGTGYRFTTKEVDPT